MFSLFSIVIFIMAVYLMNKAFFGFQPGTNKVNSDVAKFRGLAAKWKEELVKWSFEETELFSLSETNKVAKKGFGKSVEAIVQSIYHEPMLYYYYKEYPSAQKNAILFCQTNRYEIVYRIRPKGTQVFVNESFTGTIDANGSFYRESDKALIGMVNQSNPYMMPVKVGDLEIGTILFPTEKSNIQPRAFEMDEKVDEERHLLFMIQSIYQIALYLVK